MHTVSRVQEGSLCVLRGVFPVKANHFTVIWMSVFQDMIEYVVVYDIRVL